MTLIEFLHQYDYITLNPVEQAYINSNLLSFSGSASAVLDKSLLESSNIISFTQLYNSLTATSIEAIICSVSGSASAQVEKICGINTTVCSVTFSPVIISSIAYTGIYPFENKIKASVNILSIVTGSKENQIDATFTDTFTVDCQSISSIETWLENATNTIVAELNSTANAVLDRSALEVRSVQSISAIRTNVLPITPLFTHVINPEETISNITTNARVLAIVL